MSDSIRVNIPFSTELYGRIEKRTTVYGFDSVQAYLRVMVKAEVDGRKVHFDEPVLEEMSRAALIVISHQFHEHLIAYLSNEVTKFKSIEDALKYVHDYYVRQQIMVDDQIVMTSLK